MSDSDIDRLYKRWLRQNGLPFDFPKLKSDLPLEKLYQRMNFGSDVDKVIGKIGQQIERMAVIVPQGQGASTIAQRVVKANKKLLKRVGIIVYLNLDQIDEFEENFENIVTREIFRELLLSFPPDSISNMEIGRSSSHLGNDIYNLLGVEDFEHYEDLYDYVLEEYGLDDKILTPFIEGNLPIKNLSELISTIKAKLDICTVIMVKIPGDAYEDLLLECASTLKWYSESILGNKNKIPQYSSKIVILCSEKNLREIRTSWDVTFDPLPIEPYSHAELLSIFSVHYQPIIEGQILHLKDILHQDFMSLAAPNDKPISLSVIAENLKKEIKETLKSIKDPRKLPTQLIPSH